MKISMRDKILNRRRELLSLVMNGKVTVKEVAAKLNVHVRTVRLDIHAMDNIHWQDCFLYYGERL